MPDQVRPARPGLPPRNRLASAALDAARNTAVNPSKQQRPLLQSRVQTNARNKFSASPAVDLQTRHPQGQFKPGIQPPLKPAAAVGGWDDMLQSSPDLGVPQMQPAESWTDAEVQQVEPEEFVKREERRKKDKQRKPAFGKVVRC